MRKLEKGLARARARSPKLHAVDFNDEPAPEPPARDAAARDTAAFDIGGLRQVTLKRRLLARNRVIVDDPTGAGGAYKMLRTRMLQRMRQNGWKTVAVTGTCPDEGKSLTAINLSLALARDVNTEVVLVDMDLRKPSLHRCLGITARSGVGDYLDGTSDLSDIAVRTEVDRLGLLLNRHALQNSSELIASPRAEALVERLKRGNGRIVVFDMPPVLASDDVLAFTPCIDSVLLVAAQGTTRNSDLIAARDLLQNVNIVGVVLNRSSEKVAPYYYYGTG